MNLAKRVRDCRYALGLGPDELAQRADISRTALYQIETGRTTIPRAATLQRIAAALGMPVEDLIDDLAPAERTSTSLQAESSATTRSPEVERKVGAVLESPLAAGFLAVLDIWHAMIPIQRVREPV